MRLEYAFIHIRYLSYDFQLGQENDLRKSLLTSQPEYTNTYSQTLISVWSKLAVILKDSEDIHNFLTIFHTRSPNQNNQIAI